MRLSRLTNRNAKDRKLKTIIKRSLRDEDTALSKIQTKDTFSIHLPSSVYWNAKINGNSRLAKKYKQEKEEEENELRDFVKENKWPSLSKK